MCAIKFLLQKLQGNYCQKSLAEENIFLFLFLHHVGMDFT